MTHPYEAALIDMIHNGALQAVEVRTGSGQTGFLLRPHPQLINANIRAAITRKRADDEAVGE